MIKLKLREEKYYIEVDFNEEVLFQGEKKIDSDSLISLQFSIIEKNGLKKFMVFNEEGVEESKEFGSSTLD